jgi:hypothetical protein
MTTCAANSISSNGCIGSGTDLKDITVCQTVSPINEDGCGSSFATNT